jgi:hypothetical protein
MMTIPTKSIFPVITSGPWKTTSSTTTGAITPSHNQKEYNMITADIPLEVTFELPEGRYQASISSLKPYTKPSGRGPQNWIRILFDVHIPGLSERMETRAGRNFKLDLNPGSEFRNWLTGLLGKEYFKERSGQQISLDSLLNSECEVELKHFYGPGYEQPLVVVASIRPVLTSTSKANKVEAAKI